jgi:hypothetical protein
VVWEHRAARQGDRRPVGTGTARQGQALWSTTSRLARSTPLATRLRPSAVCCQSTGRVGGEVGAGAPGQVGVLPGARPSASFQRRCGTVGVSSSCTAASLPQPQPAAPAPPQVSMAALMGLDDSAAGTPPPSGPPPGPGTWDARCPASRASARPVRAATASLLGVRPVLVLFTKAGRLHVLGVSGA